MSNTLIQGVSKTERGDGYPSGGHAWLKRTIMAASNSGYSTLWTAMGDVVVTKMIVRAGGPQPAHLVLAGIYATNRQATIVEYGIDATWLNAAGKQDDGWLSPSNAGEGGSFDAIFVPNGELIELNLDAGNPGADPVLLTIYVCYEPVTVGAHLI